MQTTTDPHDALALWNADDTQWILTNGTQYVVCAEHEAVHALEATGWEMSSPEELARQIRN